MQSIRCPCCLERNLRMEEVHDEPVCKWFEHKSPTINQENVLAYGPSFLSLLQNVAAHVDIHSKSYPAFAADVWRQFQKSFELAAAPPDLRLLLTACWEKDWQRVRELIQTVPNLACPQGSVTPLHRLIWNEGPIDVAEAMIEKGIDVNHVANMDTHYSVTPLSSCVYMFKEAEYSYYSDKFCFTTIPLTIKRWRLAKMLMQRGAKQFFPQSPPFLWPKAQFIDFIHDEEVVSVYNSCIKPNFYFDNEWVGQIQDMKRARLVLMGGASFTNANLSKLWQESGNAHLKNEGAEYMCLVSGLFTLCSALCTTGTNLAGQFLRQDGDNKIMRIVKIWILPNNSLL